MDKEAIIVGGVVLGAALLIVGATRKPAQTDYVSTIYGAALQREAQAPAILAAVGEAQNRSREADNQRLQMQLAHAEHTNADILDFMATVSGQQVRRESQQLNFAGENLDSYRRADVQKRQIASTEKVALRQINAQVELAKKEMDQGFLNGIIGGITTGLNPGQSLYGGAGASGLRGTGTPASMQANTSGGSLIGQVLQAVMSIYGGGSGGMLSNLGGGIGKGGLAAGG